jgi:hypothetical protein
MRKRQRESPLALVEDVESEFDREKRFRRGCVCNDEREGLRNRNEREREV